MNIQRKPYLLLLALLLTWGLLSSIQAFAAAKDACSIVTTDDAAAAIGEPVRPGRSEPRSMNGAEGTNCRFRSTQGSALSGKTVSVTVEYSSTDISGNTHGMADNLKSSGFKDVREISGVGDAAVWGTTSMMGRPTAELTVQKGKSIILIIILAGIPDNAIALARAKDLAMKILPRA